MTYDYTMVHGGRHGANPQQTMLMVAVPLSCPSQSSLWISFRVNKFETQRRKPAVSPACVVSELIPWCFLRSLDTRPASFLFLSIKLICGGSISHPLKMEELLRVCEKSHMSRKNKCRRTTAHPHKTEGPGSTVSL